MFHTTIRSCALCAIGRTGTRTARTAREHLRVMKKNGANKYDSDSPSLKTIVSRVWRRENMYFSATLTKTTRLQAPASGTRAKLGSLEAKRSQHI
jgi:hypothetical protein